MALFSLGFGALGLWAKNSSHFAAVLTPGHRDIAKMNSLQKRRMDLRCTRRDPCRIVESGDGDGNPVIPKENIGNLYRKSMKIMPFMGHHGTIPQEKPTFRT